VHETFHQFQQQLLRSILADDAAHWTTAVAAALGQSGTPAFLPNSSAL
jgi:hypothetical protein